MKIGKDDFCVVLGCCCVFLSIAVRFNKMVHYLLFCMGMVFILAGFLIMLKRKKYD
jgi:hypothetical protein